MTHILFVSSYTGLGGGETASLTLADHLDGYTPHLFVPTEGAFSTAWRERDWPVHVQPYRGATVYFVPAVWARLPISRRIERVIRECGIDVVHSDYHTLPMALPAAHRAGVPCVWTCMGWWFQPKRWQRGFFQQADATFAHSQAIRDGFLGQPPFMPPERVQVLYPGVDTTRFNPRHNGSPVRDEIGAWDVPVVAMVGRFQRVKGQDVFIRMAARVARRFPQAHFVIVGENLQSAADRHYKQQVLALAKAHPRLRLHFLGYRADVETVMAAADVMVCPSQFESFGVANMEAMASGRPVVSTNRGGPAEVVVDGVTGYLVAPNNPAALADRVIELLHSPHTRRAFGAAGRMRAQQVFRAGAVAAAFDARVREVL